MKPEFKYIELKSGYSDKGPAWIGMAEFSKSGQTIYFNGRAFKKSGGQGVEGNFYDLESGYEYWISSVKKNGEDRHWAGSGKILMDRKVVDLYLKKVSFDALDKNKFELFDVLPTDKQKFAQIENEPFVP